MLNWNEILGIWKQTDYLNALVCDPYHFIGHQQHCFNEGGYLVCDNVPLGFYQCDMKAEWAWTMIQSFLPLASCFSPLLVQEFLLLIKMMTLPQNSMKGKSNSSSIYAPEVCVFIRQWNYVLENFKKRHHWWPWKFKCAWFTSPACLLRFFITVINCVWIQLHPHVHLAVHSNLFSKMFCPSSDNKWCTENCKNVWLPDSNHICGDLWI